MSEFMGLIVGTYEAKVRRQKFFKIYANLCKCDLKDFDGLLNLVLHQVSNMPVCSSITDQYTGMKYWCFKINELK